MKRDEVKLHKDATSGQYLAILTELAWSIDDLLYGIKNTEQKKRSTSSVSLTDFYPEDELVARYLGGRKGYSLRAR